MGESGFWGGHYVVDVGQVESCDKARTSEDIHVNLTRDRVVFNFGFKGTIGKEKFYAFNNLYPDVKGGEFVEETYVSDSVEGFLHVKKHKDCMNIDVKVFL